jgi:hypothetical protein
MILYTIIILYFLTYFNRFSILYSNREYFIVSLEVVENGENNMEIATVIKNRTCFYSTYFK